jgi:DNA polymerase-3 subunit alpha
MDTGNLPKFVHLRVRSAYSLLEGALPIKKLAKLAVADKMPALAITDANNMFGLLEFSETLSTAGVQPVMGSSVSVDFGGESGVDGTIALLAKNETGYKNLMKLSSSAFLDSKDTEPAHVKVCFLRKHSDGLIALTGGHEGPVDKYLINGDEEKAGNILDELAGIFPDRLYVELQRHNIGGERLVEELADARGVPVVATNDVHFPVREDYEAHDVLICIAESSYVSQDDRRRLTDQHYFKSQAEMCELFADRPDALANTVEIARRCAYRCLTHDPILPNYTDGNISEADALRAQAKAGLEQRLQANAIASGHNREDYYKRLDFELDIITQMGFPGYFLIVSDFIKWAKDNDIPVGPGRGSGAGSLVAWSLTITDLDPIRFGLLFERFLNPERISMPDFDVDFCQDRRDEVIRYVQDKYGHDRVAQIITFGKLQARAVMRDVGRVLQMPYTQVDRLCKLVPNAPGKQVSIAEAIEVEPKLREERDAEEIVAHMLAIAQKLEGLYRHASTHAAGVVIGDRPLNELVPLYRDPRSPLPATQFNMKWVEPAGLVKFDFLGLKTLTVIQKAAELVEKVHGKKIDFSSSSLDDQLTFELLANADTVGVFQLESSGMRESLRKLGPDRIEDIIAMVSLYRPGPMDNIPTYINRKFGREDPDYFHPSLEPVLHETYGVIIYQEQVMQIAQILAGYSLGEADILRRAMGKKDPAEMDRQRTRFVEGALQRGVDEKQANFIFDLVNKFAGYGFNKSHAAAYALLAYQTAYLKANYPVEFMAAIMTLDQGNTDKVQQFYVEADEMGITVRPPCVNFSTAEFIPEEGTIRYSLAALKNIGVQAVECIVSERKRGGQFKSIDDFASRIDPAAVNKRAMETMVMAGAFDALEKNRATVFAGIEAIMATASRTAREREEGQSSLFGDAPDTSGLALQSQKPWVLTEKLTREHDAAGFFLSGHPLDEYAGLLDRTGVVRWSDFAGQVQGGVSAGMLAGTVTYLQERRSKSGNKFAFAGFSDQSGQFEVVIFADTLASSREILTVGRPVLLRVEAEADGENIKTRAQSIELLDKVSERNHNGLEIVVDTDEPMMEIARQLKAGGRARLRLCLQIDGGKSKVEMEIPGSIDSSLANINAMRQLDGIVSIRQC